MKIAATEFKARCLSVMDRVARSREEVVITKHGRPVAKLVPADADAPVDAFGFLSESVARAGDIVSPIDERWNAEQR